MSNTDSSRSDSWLARLGAGGSGLFISRIVGVEGPELCCDSFECADSGGVSPSSSLDSFPSSSLINFPCFEFGGVGFCLFDSDLSRPILGRSSSDIS